MGEPWFGPKAYGIGLTPTTFAGWAVTLLFVVAAVGEAVGERALRWPPLVIGGSMILTIALYLALVAWKSEKSTWRWRWGGR